jgi:nitroreductase
VDVYEALYTTRAMRRVKPDPIPESVQAKILDAAIRAPSGGNTQNWRFVLVDDKDVIGRLAPIYQRCMAQLWSGYYKDRIDAMEAEPEAQSSKDMSKMVRSAQHLADHFADVPLLLFAFSQGDPSGSSLYPAVWSAQLAARAEGVGSAITQAMVFELDNTLEVLQVPKDQNWYMSACVTFGYPTGKWGVAQRRPVDEVAFKNSFDGPLGFSVPEPLWP